MDIIQTQKSCQTAYGFISDANKQKFENVRDALKNMPIRKYFDNIENAACHDLCTYLQPPPGLKYALGLGLKFVLQKKIPKNDIERTLRRLQRDVRIKHFFAGEKANDITYSKNLHLPSKWEPPKCHPIIENMLENFATEITQARRCAVQKRHSNITKHQYNILHQMKTSPDFIIWQTDKNLGPAIIERCEYIKRAYTDHLNNTNAYRKLQKGIALQRIRRLLPKKVKKFFWDNVDEFSETEVRYFKRLFTIKHRTPQFYLTCKIHKTPWTTRPVVATCGSIIAGLSTWVDYWLQKVVKTVPTYLKNSAELTKVFSNMSKIEPNSIIFTADATSMYTNIDTTHGIDTIKAYLQEFSNEIPNNLPIDLVVTGLKIVMDNANFQFGENFFEQISGTSMGTPCACSYATIYYGYHERKTIIPRFGSYLKVFKRYIDDGFGILTVPPTLNQDKIWDDFKNSWPFGNLKFTFHKSYNEINFLDLTVYINKNKKLLETSTFQKAMNLYLYLPPKSAHPSGVIKGMIHGCLHTLWKQNSQKENYQKFAKLFFDRLLARGHKKDDITELFLLAAKKFDSKDNDSRLRIKSNAENKASEEKKDRLFLHFEFHPRDISRQTIHKIFERTCLNPNETTCNMNVFPNKFGKVMKIEKATVAYTRAKNIREIVTSSKLYLPNK